MTYDFETVDVFTDRRFSGNPLAVFTDAAGMPTETMQALAAEMNLSETTFVLPPDDPSNTARVRIFNRTAEMPFAGHPMIGTAFVLANAGVGDGATMKLEVPAGLVAVELERDAGTIVVGGRIVAPQPLSLGIQIPSETVAACVGIRHDDVLVDHHRPVVASVGNPYIVAQVTDDALSSCVPDRNAFGRAVAAYPQLNGRFSLHLYAGDGPHLRARMFAPLAGTVEDPATGSANAPLGALLLSLRDADEAKFTIHQGVEMGRPSVLHVVARRSDKGIVASVAGRCVAVFVGQVQLD
jgi:trans-2,3-dihydro-3-hydroxyanthranilate isomerase